MSNEEREVLVELQNLDEFLKLLKMLALRYIRERLLAWWVSQDAVRQPVGGP